MTATAPEKLTALRTAVCAVCAGVLLYGIGDEAVFGSGWYRRFLDPNSLAGRIELTIAMARRATPSPVPEIAVVGNSVLAEGSPPKQATPRRTDACGFQTSQAEQYSDEDGWIPQADTIADLHIINALLAPADIPDFAFSFQDPRNDTR